MKKYFLKLGLVITLGSLILFSAGCASGKKKKSDKDKKEKKESGILGPLKSLFDKDKDKK